MPFSPTYGDNEIFELAHDELDRLPFGVVTLDREGTILRYNLVEASLARRAAAETIGRKFFTEVAPCANVQAFRGRFDAFAKRRDSGVECFDFTFRFNWGRHDVSITMVRKAGYDAINLLVRERIPATPRTLPAPAAPLVPPVARTGGVELLGTPRMWTLGGSEEARLRRLVHPDDAANVERAVAAAAADRLPYAIEYRTIGPDEAVSVVQEIGFFDAAEPTSGRAAIVDVTARHEREREQWRVAHHDPLTGLPNRRLFAQRVDEAIRDAAAACGIVAVLMTNVDRFRETNDMFGRELGNRLLCMLAKRIADAANNGDSVAHLGMDMFGVVVRSAANASDIAVIASHLLTAASTPFVIDGRSYHLTMSIGISVGPVDGDHSDSLQQCAYAALRAAKTAGRNGFCWYRSEMSIDAANNGRRSRALRAALESDEFVLHYQPIVDIEQNRVVAVESLTRWNHPTRGMLPPGEFIELADRTGMIIPLGEWVLREACRQAREWFDRGLDIRVCVNVSAVQFRQPNFVATVAAVLHEIGLPPDRLEIELTETVMIDGIKEMMERLTRLKALGVRLAIDDFGTGYSSLAYLKYFPVDTLKIDRAFVTDIAADSFDRAIATTVFTLANALGLDCVVEGVENEEQLDTLIAIGCSVMQGYYFCKPMAPDQLDALLDRAPYTLHAR